MVTDWLMDNPTPTWSKELATAANTHHQQLYKY